MTNAETFTLILSMLQSKNRRTVSTYIPVGLKEEIVTNSREMGMTVSGYVAFACEYASNFVPPDKITDLLVEVKEDKEDEKCIISVSIPEVTLAKIDYFASKLTNRSQVIARFCEYTVENFECRRI